ncbi:MAG TPA: hypothetical protein VJQ52_14660 [Steroidobacteraceae bacterium]|nr:hypothetical protein [Steroidobacteraceae bacterium]
MKSQRFRSVVRRLGYPALTAALVLSAAAQAAPKAPEFTHPSQVDWINSKPLCTRSSNAMPARTS